MTKKTVTIKLIGINFVPTIRTLDEKGVVMDRRTMIGQMQLDVNELPDALQAELREIIGEAYRREVLRYSK